MALLDYYAHECQILERVRLNDNQGGYYTEWREGATFTNYQALNTSTEAQIAEKQGITSIYGALVEQSVPLAYGDYYRDNADGETFRVTSEPNESYTPSSSGLNLKYYSSEKAVLPT